MNKPAAYAQDDLLDRQRAAWAGGTQPPPEEFLSGEPSEYSGAVLLDLIYNEIIIREEQGDLPTLEEYVSRYPALAADLHVQFEVHAAVRGDKANTLRLSGTDPGSHFPPPQTVTHRTAVAGYEILGSLGEGGMGAVFKARDQSLNRLVALKMIRPGHVPSDRERRRFRTEAEAIARLRHPNIVRIHEVGEIDGAPYLSLELAEGGTLAGRLREFPYTPRAAADLIRTLAAAIQHAHDHGIVHRDLKPANILFGADGSPRVADFGLAKIVEDGDAGRDHTHPGEPVGTPRYMSPEQAAGTAGVGAPADVHALGLLLYECLTGQSPFVSATAVQTMERVRDEEPLPPRRLQAKIPKDVETICLHCLRKEPGWRYASAQAVADDLGRFLDGKPILARPTPAWEKTWKWGRRHPAAAAGIAAAVLLAAAAGGYFQVRGEMEARRVAGLRGETLQLMDDGRLALARRDPRAAQARFLDAWTKSRAEPALADLTTAVSGWLDHARRDEEQGVWNKRAGPRLYEDVRDEAFLLALLAGKGDGVIRADSFSHARGLAADGEPGWDFERELLAVMEAESALAAGDAGAALTLLDHIPNPTTRLWHRKKAACFDALGRGPEAAAARAAADALPPLPVWELIDRGVVLCHQGAFREAERAFDAALAADAGHFPARVFQAVCFLRSGRPAEAKVGLTACVAQRPAFAWGYLLRGDAHQLLGDAAAAKADFERILGMKLSDALRRHLSERLGSLENTPGDRPAGADKAGGGRE